ncbi:Alpha/Beta hydrolase protein [Crepidotus variabilis]|uniref:triacylglycerol lipase n=1 Tax=Crepidotus variabilis TaxID=179855 RepID=A0A9P6JTC8_9AGAR|nr:Alpha/Beta hydrolase protein [Crepidotus variabilis]
MLSRSLLLIISLYLSTHRLCSAEYISFSSQQELSLADSVPFEDSDIHFTPSSTFALAQPRLSSSSNRLTLGTRQTTVYRPRSLDVLHKVRLRSLQHSQSESERPLWDKLVVEGPDVEDLHTLAQLARMSGNAYALPGQSNWYDVDGSWNRSFPYGWEESDGFRGHVFMSSDNSTIVLSIKGTTLQGPTSKLDKFNDNLLFSCCCARVDFSWVLRTVCDCYAKGFRCDNQCLTDALIQDSLFYSIGIKLVDDLRKIYPSANLWLVGHSLGGALASLLGATYGLPAVAFEAPGERLAATRLHLPLPPPILLPRPKPTLPATFPLPTQYPRFIFSKLGLRLPHLKFPFPFPTSTDLPNKPTSAPIPPPHPPQPPPSHHPIATTHVYHTADPIPQGACTGFRSPCASAGYALETRCHLGQSIIFDTISEMGWKSDVRKHIIKSVVTEVLEGGTWWGRVPRNEGDSSKGATKFGIGKRKNKKGEEEEREGEGNVPKPIIETNCVDCYKWEFGDFKDELRRP